MTLLRFQRLNSSEQRLVLGAEVLDGFDQQTNHIAVRDGQGFTLHHGLRQDRLNFLSNDTGVAALVIGGSAGRSAGARAPAR